MSTRAQLITLLDQKILTGGRRTTALFVRQLMADVISSTYNITDDGPLVPYNGANANVDLGSQNLTTTGLLNVGNGFASDQRQVRFGQDSSFIDIGSRVGTASQAAIYMNSAIPTSSNYVIACDGGNILINSPGSGSTTTFLADNNTYMIGTVDGISFLAGKGVQFDAAVGGYVGKSSTDRMGLWGSTPVVQPTTSNTSPAAIVSGGGTGLTDTDTIGNTGWTWAKFAQAVFNTGILND